MNHLTLAVFVTSTSPLLHALRLPTPLPRSSSGPSALLYILLLVDVYVSILVRCSIIPSLHAAIALLRSSLFASLLLSIVLNSVSLNPGSQHMLSCPSFIIKTFIAIAFNSLLYICIYHRSHTALSYFALLCRGPCSLLLKSLRSSSSTSPLYSTHEFHCIAGLLYVSTKTNCIAYEQQNIAMG